jgi:hypothetical protein
MPEKTMDPKWNVSFQFEVLDPSARLLVEIYDHDLFGAAMVLMIFWAF